MTKSTSLPRRDRYARMRHIKTLDPARDHLEIYRISSGYEFPWDYLRATELALLRTFAVPSIGELLDATGQFECAAQRRYDDTFILMGALARYGYDSPEGRTALRTVNRAHSWYRISNDDMLYTLSSFIFEPIKWIAAHGWRPLLQEEKHAAFWFYRNIGLRLGIKDIPSSYAQLQELNTHYERTAFGPTDAGRRVADHALTAMCGWFPLPLRPFVRPVVLSMLDEPLRTALGYPSPPTALTSLTHGALRARARLLRLASPRRVSRFDVLPTVRTYTLGGPGCTMDKFGVAKPTPVAAHWRAPDAPTTEAKTP
ncbi:DUF2236 domain-containing protein [Streptomyces sp. NBC_01283]|uniref:oxygenase MpaB family protein n=1 Tax=Streptomyces sp. NBC_01283 TaxID=2903812 RepID=UPI00352EAAEB|nr:DUF2236 domain-containing protein [Streptomyces sp. NBC_01283]